MHRSLYLSFSLLVVPLSSPICALPLKVNTVSAGPTGLQISEIGFGTWAWGNKLLWVSNGSFFIGRLSIGKRRLIRIFLCADELYSSF